ncbi:MAG: acyltransferase [Chloroflexi bacterium]|uniref:Acyltransferase n=1 Tax=Candidatus Chlorohelix allophototropha TaxID=3003348 RepID=A0A8T7M1I9_9CHLR|nr:acyltransferase [Chloroflexota bacterium]
MPVVDKTLETLKQLKGQARLAKLRRYFRIGTNVLRAKIYLRKASFLGKYVQVLGNPRIGVWGGEMIIHNKVVIDSIVARVEIVANKGGRLEIGEGTYINYGTSIACSKSIVIGKKCLIGTYCNIIDNDYHGILDRDKPAPSQEVVLEDNVWIGGKVIILKGVTIGKDSVVAAGSVVTRSIPPRCIAAGVPAKIIKTF